METLFIHVLHMSISASYLILAVLAVRFLLRKAPKGMRCFLWLLVGIRLLLPFSAESVFSLVPDVSAVYEQSSIQRPEGLLDAMVPVPPVNMEIQNGAALKQAAGQAAQRPGSAGSISVVCAGLWALGVAGMLGYFAISWICLRLRVRTAVPVDVAIDEEHRTRIYQSERIDSPFLFGVAVPRIYIPTSMADENLPYVILHEKAHIRHRDYLIKPAGFLILAVHWFNPLVWAAYALLCKDIELVCDERVIRELGDPCKKAYSQALLTGTVSRRMVTACPVAFGEVDVRERVKNVLHYKKPAFWLLIAAALACVVVPVCFMTQKKEGAAEFVKTDAAAQKTEETAEQEAALQQSRFEVLEEKLKAEQAAFEAQQTALYREVAAAEERRKNAEDMHGYIEQWAQAFCNRDAGTIIRLADDKVGQKLENADLLTHGFADGKDYAGFGWSSPWPWGNETSGDGTAQVANYRIVNVTDCSAEILYYAWASDPHVTVWRELLTFDMKNDAFVITSETLTYMDNICTVDQFYQAYPGGVISGTMMDYYEYNGAGEALNDNAKAGRVDAALFEADRAAMYLLNLSGSARIGFTGDANVRAVQIMFDDGSSVEVTMVQPYGADGIWLPWSGRDAGLDGIQTAGMTYTAENIDDLMQACAARLETLFPNPHEFMESATFPQYADLDGDGEAEKIEMTDLRYNGGDGGYALRVTTKTGEEIPLPAGYTQESGFPLSTTYTPPVDGEDAWISIRWGKEKRDTTIAALSQQALIHIYDKKRMYLEFKQVYNPREPLQIDAPSGCSIVTYQGEKNPVLALKSYVSGYLGHADTLGYVITELRLQEDHTWNVYSYFLLDGDVQTETKIGQVTAQTLKVRSEASTDANVIGLLENGQSVTILSEGNGFYYICIPSKDNPDDVVAGYVKKEYIRIR